MAELLDNPLFSSVAFHPRKHPIGNSSVLAYDGNVPVRNAQEKITLGYRFFPPAPQQQQQHPPPVFLFFHGNAENASDYDRSSAKFREIVEGSGLVVFDYRGYGWSTGSPVLSKFLPDVESIINVLPEILIKAQCSLANNPIFLFGRSIGSACAIHLASKYSEIFQGLVIESGLNVMTELPMVQQMSNMIPNGRDLINSVPDIFENAKKLSAIKMPILIIHGEDDKIVPVIHAKQLHASACISTRKVLKIFPNAGHNDLTVQYGIDYYDEIAAFVLPTISKCKVSSISEKLQDIEKLFSIGNYGQAIAVCSDICITDVQDSTDRINYFKILTKNYIGIGNFGSAIDKSTAGLCYDPTNTDLLLLQAKAYIKLGQPKAASSVIDLAVKLTYQASPSLPVDAIKASFLLFMAGN